MPKLTVSKLLQNQLVVKLDPGSDFFISTSRGFIISIENYLTLLKFLIESNFLNHETVEGLLEEFHSDYGRKDKK